jgi:septal ring-binding cell division protein DamX
MLRAVQQALVAEFAAGRQIVLLIDEAHAMPADTLEQIRLLSNLESERHKLIKIALFGQPELDALLDRPDMRQLKDRITQHFRLDPLAPDDVATYIDFRMRAAGYRGPTVFERAATARIARDSGGLTRRINVLADKSLLAAFARNAHAVTLADAQRAAADTQTRADLPPQRKAARNALLLLGAVALLGAGYLLGRSDRVAAPPVADVVAARTEAVAAQLPSVAPAPAEPPASAQEPATPPAPASADPLESLLAASRAWSATAPGERWFVQLMSVPAGRADHVIDYVRRAGRALDPQQLRAYRTDTAGDPQLAVIYGDFADLRSAQQAVDAMPDWIRGTRPLVRQLRSLRADAQ